MATKRAKAPKSDEPEKIIVETITGFHPILWHKHTMTRYADDTVLIEREPSWSRNPVTEEWESKEYAVITEKLENHRYLWDLIKTNPHLP